MLSDAPFLAHSHRPPTVTDLGKRLGRRLLLILRALHLVWVVLERQFPVRALDRGRVRMARDLKDVVVVATAQQREG